MPSLVLQESAVGAPENGPHSVAAALLDHKPVLVAAVGDRVDLLDEGCKLVQGLLLEEAFPGQAGEGKVDAVAVDVSSGRITAVSRRRIAVWTSGRGQSWRIHSSFAVSHDVQAIDFVKGMIVVAGEAATLWSLDERGALPVWTRVGSLPPNRLVSLARLSPSALVLATVAPTSSTVVLINVLPASSTSANRLSFRSRAIHSVRIRSVSWRPSDDIADSGPVLFTQTIDGVFRVWGCVIDEPDFFSLWTSLDVHSTLPKQLPLATLYWRTRPMERTQHPERGGTEDDFVTVFSDGSVHLTTVSNFDCRPPTCLTQTTEVLQENVFQPTELPNFRYPHLLPSRSDPASFHLIGRSSRGTFVHSRATVPTSRLIAATKPVFHGSPVAPSVSVVGRIRQLRPTLKGDGEAVLVLGENGRIQSWEMGDDEVVTESFVADAHLPPDAKIATWRGGRVIASASGDRVQVLKFRRSGQLRFITAAKSPVSMDDALTFFVVRTNEDSLSTTIVGVTSESVIRTWIYHYPSKSLTDGPSHDLGATRYTLASPVPIEPGLEVVDEVSVVLLDEEGTLHRWSTRLSEPYEGWYPDGTVKTGLKKVQAIACSWDGTSAFVSLEDDDRPRLSIWNPKASEFSSGEQFSQALDDPLVKLEWSVDGRTLAVAAAKEVSLWCAQRLDDLTGRPSWTTYATVRIDDVLPAPITNVRWLATGLAVAAADHLFFYSSKLDAGHQDAHRLAASLCAPLPLHHPQLLFQALLQGLFDVVVKVLVGLAAELTMDGHLTPVPMKEGVQKLTLDAFLRNPHRSTKKKSASHDIFAALTTSGSSSSSSEPRPSLSADDVSRLLAALRRRSLHGLNKLDHEHLAVLVQTVFETQSRTLALDDNGVRFLISMRSFFLYNTSPASPPSSTPSGNQKPTPRLQYRDMVWAFHSENQDVLLEECTKASGGKLTWAAARTLGVALWLKSPEVLVRTIESIGRTEFSKPDAEDRDPISAMLFYLALKKRHIVTTFWKQASGHAEQRQMIKFLSNDFDEPRWKSAALKNAFALMSKQRFLFAAAFFLLGGSLKDAVSVCIRQLDDFQLAIALARTYEGGDDGPVLRSLLEETVVPLAFAKGYRWLGSWALWMLGRRDLAVQIIVTPLSDLATRLPYKLPVVSSPAREDPALVFLFAQLRSWSLQTVKGAIAVPGKTEFNFVLHISRILCRMGCHVLALNLLRTWQFAPPSASAAPCRPSLLGAHTRRHSLLLSSTKLDISLPPSNMPSRVASPAPVQAEGEDAEERERQRKQFREVVKTVRVEAKAPAEFSFDAFNF
ncbi:hypothetical protein NBRC10512_002265 [Rhodotorula toruloides]|uniref:RHTO0S08e06986g1_1 n=2 Tax=Rhodotorula toruloides TaxID=5286 RepID=A0A061B1P2_RHOTO|nr:WD repeat protein [Rhodotorula toruloides NP11]EMS22197.1 WD repeat protein [Rhodotorula toruloides NP11]CDR43849.1 RHTO0S08e06986g1_1 [Rhodotorula toruloides]